MKVAKYERAEEIYSTLEEKKLDKEEGKSLSSNDFTDALKTKLDGIAIGATKTTVDSALSSTSTNPVQNKVINGALASKLDSTATAVSAQKLSTARTINNVSFDGSSDIKIAGATVVCGSDVVGTTAGWYKWGEYTFTEEYSDLNLVYTVEESFHEASGIFVARVRYNTGTNMFIGKNHCISTNLSSLATDIKIVQNSKTVEFYVYCAGLNRRKNITILSCSPRVESHLKKINVNVMKLYNNVTTQTDLTNLTVLSTSSLKNYASNATNSVTSNSSYNLKRSCLLQGGASNNYPYRRFATIKKFTSNYIDICDTILLGEYFHGGRWAIIRLECRSNNQASSATDLSVNVLLCSESFDTSRLVAKMINKNGYTIIDFFYKVPNSYPRTVVTVLSHEGGSIDTHSVTYIDSNETNATEAYTSMDEAATKLYSDSYTNTRTSVYTGVVNKARMLTGFTNSYTDPPTWGTLTKTNNYSNVHHCITSTSSSYAFCEKSGQLFMQIDGFYYQNEGRYQVLDTNTGVSKSQLTNTYNTLTPTNSCTASSTKLEYTKTATNVVQLRGYFQLSAITNSTTIGTLPSGYRPSTSGVLFNIFDSISGGFYRGRIGTDGVITVGLGTSMSTGRKFDFTINFIL